MKFSTQGQTILEYTIIVGIVTMMLFYLGTGVKRGVQSVVKITADQVGSQQNADQDFNDTQQGYLEQSNTAIQDFRNKQVTELGYIPKNSNAVYDTGIYTNELTNTQSSMITNAGFSPNN